MGYDKTARLLNSLRSPQEVRTAIAGQGDEGMFLPNHSGISTHPEFKKALSQVAGGVQLVTANPATATEGTMILNTSTNTISVMYLGVWRDLHTITLADFFILLETGDTILLETGDKIKG